MPMPPGMHVPYHMHYASMGYQMPYGLPPGFDQQQVTVQLPAGAVPPPQVQAALMSGQPLQEEQPKTELDPAAAALKAQRKKEKQKLNKLEIFGNATTMNLQRIIHMNIQSSSYFKDLMYVFSYYTTTATNPIPLDDSKLTMKLSMKFIIKCPI